MTYLAPVDNHRQTLPKAVDSSSREQALQDAFALFSDLSEQLTVSYRQLEARVAVLNAELNEVSDQRMQELAEKERLAHRLETLINFLPGGVIVLDCTGVVREANPVAVELLGEPLTGQMWRTLVAERFAPRQDDGHEISLADGRRLSLATRDLGADGQIILLTDQTETRRLQSELSRHERLSALGQMVSALAHQIRTPLSAAMLYAGHLARPALDENKRQQMTEKMTSRLRHMERQVRDMLLYVKGELPLNDLLSVAQLQMELTEAMEVPLQAAPGVQCQWQVDSCGERLLSCNRDALVSALLNLVENALEAGEADMSLALSLMVLKGEAGDYLQIKVTDDGPGMSEQMVAHARELFVTHKAQGTGLGLAVVEAVARAHRGRFILHSTPGQGTCATVLLPLYQ